MSEIDKKIDLLKRNVDDYPDFPKPGILFKDIFGIFKKPELIPILKEVLVHFAASKPPVECVVALDARGFLLGPMIAMELKVPFVPIRKKGKLPGPVTSESYALEYGEGIVEIQVDSIQKNQNVLIFDDLLATGGTLQAACNLVEKLGGNVQLCLVLMELTGLNGRNKITADVVSVIQY